MSTEKEKMLAASKSSFPAVADARTQLLILGSLPGEISLAHAQYYANPRNQFWRLMEAVTGRTLVSAAYKSRLETLLSAGVGVWDVIASAERVGSLDTNIRNHQPNTLGAFAAGLPSLKAIAFNGGKAAGIGRKQLAADAGYELITLPSSSPAHAVPFERKLEQWRALSAFVCATS
ncbi:MAG: DNA-deoxyinosine glycosylase [Pseudomonadota bacterium]|uniref:DNA-deoxyinosine glycosylase n=1 Tax=Phenylobacterium sp. TaxID=1871053 RepID=UPI0025FDBA1A|nr:DNA-deoxyinosine glycosylase [Phenylobacterium sp.]